MLYVYVPVLRAKRSRYNLLWPFHILRAVTVIQLTPIYAHKLPSLSPISSLSLSLPFTIPPFHYPSLSLSLPFTIPPFHYPSLSLSLPFTIPPFHYPSLSLSLSYFPSQSSDKITYCNKQVQKWLVSYSQSKGGYELVGSELEERMRQLWETRNHDSSLYH